MLQPTGLSVMRELGLEEQTLQFAQKIDTLYCRTLGGTVLLDLSYRDLDPAIFGLGTHRASLLRLLLDAATQAGSTIFWGEEIVSSTRDDKDTQTLTSKHDKQFGPFDLVLICDGAQSILRKSSGLKARVDQYPWGALWFIGKRTEEFSHKTLWQCVGSTRELAGFLPTGTEQDLLSLFWSIRLDQIEDWKSKPIKQWKDDLLRLVPQAETFLDQIQDHSQLATATYHDVRMPCWHGKGTAILGDAAHALSLIHI